MCAVSYRRLIGSTLPAFGFGTSTAYMPARQRSIGLPMRSRKAARDVTTCLRVMLESKRELRRVSTCAIPRNAVLYLGGGRVVDGVLTGGM